MNASHINSAASHVSAITISESRCSADRFACHRLTKHLLGSLSLALAVVAASPAAAEVQFRTQFLEEDEIVDVAADDVGNIFVSTIPERIKKYSDAGDLLQTTFTQLVTGLAVDAGGVVYAATADGNVTPGRDVIKTYSNDFMSRDADKTPLVFSLAEIAVGPFLNIYVSSTQPSEISKLSPSGQVIWQISGHGGSGIAVDVADNVYVVDSAANGQRILKYSSTGNLLLQFGAPGSAPGELGRAVALGVDPRNGEIFIADQENRRVSRYHADGSFRDLVVDPVPGPMTALEVDRAGNLYVAHYDPIQQVDVVAVYDRIVEINELRLLVDALLINAPPSDAFPGFEQFTDLVRQASRTDLGKRSTAEIVNLLPGLRNQVAQFEFNAGPEYRQAGNGASLVIETIDGLATHYLTNPSDEEEHRTPPIYLAGSLKDPFYGRYFTDTPIGFPLPAHVDFVLDPNSAVTTISKPEALGGRVQPRVLGSTIGVDIIGVDLRVTDITFEFESFELGDQSTGINRGFLPPGAQVWAQLTGPTSFEGHAEGWIVNDLYPASRPLFTFVDLNGYFFAAQGRNDATVYGVNEPIIAPGLPGAPLTAFAGEAYVATRAKFVAATGRLFFQENTDLDLLPDVSVILTPTDVFAHGVGAGEALVGATLEISPLVLVGADPLGNLLFADSSFEFRNLLGVFARGRLTNVFIDADSFAFTAEVSFDDVPGALDSAFVDLWRANAGPLELLSDEATLLLLAATDDFTADGQTNTDFIRLAAVPEPTGWLLIAIAAPLIARLHSNN